MDLSIDQEDLDRLENTREIVTIELFVEKWKNEIVKVKLQQMKFLPAEEDNGLEVFASMISSVLQFNILNPWEIFCWFFIHELLD